MKELEICILKEDEEIYDISGDDCDKYEENFRKEFEQTEVGKALLKSNYICIDRDFDDCTLSLIYKHKESWYEAID